MNTTRRGIACVRLGVPIVLALIGSACADTHTHTSRDAAQQSLEAGIASPDAGLPEAALASADAGADADADAATDADAGTWDPQEALCPRRGTACPSAAWYPSFDAWNTLLEAREFGQGTRFRALHGKAVALQDAKDAWSVVRVRFTDSDPPIAYVKYALPAGQQLVAVVDRIEKVLVLSRPAPGQDCVVLETGPEPVPHPRDNGGMLVPSNVPPVPSSFEARGMYGGFEGLCVYGRGLWCLRGSSWQSQLDQNPEIRQVRLIGEHAAIETVAGTFWVSEVDAAGNATYRPYPDLSVLDPELNQRARWTQLRDDQLWFWNGKALAPCSATPPLVLQLGGRALSTDGTVFGYDRVQQRYCEGQQLGPLPPAIGVSHPTCGIVTNSFVLTESLLLGTTACAVD